MDDIIANDKPPAIYYGDFVTLIQPLREHNSIELFQGDIHCSDTITNPKEYMGFVVNILNKFVEAVSYDELCETIVVHKIPHIFLVVNDCNKGYITFKDIKRKINNKLLEFITIMDYKRHIETEFENGDILKFRNNYKTDIVGNVVVLDDGYLRKNNTIYGSGRKDKTIDIMGITKNKTIVVRTVKSYLLTCYKS